MLELPTQDIIIAINLFPIYNPFENPNEKYPVRVFFLTFTKFWCIIVLLYNPRGIYLWLKKLVKFANNQVECIRCVKYILK